MPSLPEPSTKYPSDEEVKHFVAELDLDSPLGNNYRSWFMGHGAESHNAQALVRLLVFLNPAALDRVKCPKTGKNHRLGIIIGKKQPIKMGAFTDAHIGGKRCNTCCQIIPKPLPIAERDRLQVAYRMWTERKHEHQQRLKDAKKAHKKAQATSAPRKRKAKNPVQLPPSPPDTSPIRPAPSSSNASASVVTSSNKGKSRLIESLDQYFEDEFADRDAGPSTHTPPETGAEDKTLASLQYPSPLSSPIKNKTSTSASSSKPPSLSLVGGRLSMPSFLALRQSDKNASTSTAPPALTAAEPVNISSGSDDSDDDIDSFHASDDSDEDIDSFHAPETSNFLGTIDISSEEEDDHGHFANDATTSSTGPIQVPDDDEIPNAGVIIASKGKDKNPAPDNDVPTSTTASSSGPSRVLATPRFLGIIDISSDEEDHSPLANNVAPAFSNNGRFAREVIVISSDEEEHNDHLDIIPLTFLLGHYYLDTSSLA